MKAENVEMELFVTVTKRAILPTAEKVEWKIISLLTIVEWCNKAKGTLALFLLAGLCT